MISPETIKKLHELNCEDVARRLGLEVNMHQAHCFMHQDKRPSLAFKNNLWKCFACDKGGDAISLVEEKCNLSFVEACTWLCEQYHIYMPSTNLKNTKGEFYQFNLSSCIRQQNSLTAQFVSFSLANLANIFYPPDFYNN